MYKSMRSDIKPIDAWVMKTLIQIFTIWATPICRKCEKLSWQMFGIDWFGAFAYGKSFPRVCKHFAGLEARLACLISYKSIYQPCYKTFIIMMITPPPVESVQWVTEYIQVF